MQIVLHFLAHFLVAIKDTWFWIPLMSVYPSAPSERFRGHCFELIFSTLTELSLWIGKSMPSLCSMQLLCAHGKLDNSKGALVPIHGTVNDPTFKTVLII
jgi:hypothetical protein